MNRPSSRILSGIFQACIIIGLGLLLYAPVLNTPFLFDDLSFIVNNPTIRNPADWQAVFNGVLSQPSRFVGFYSFALNYHFHRLAPFGYHVTNLGIHILAAFMVGWLVRLVCSLARPAGEEPPGCAGYVPFLAALLFLVHPVQTQAVSYLSQRFASLAALFYVSSLCFFLKGRMGLGTASGLRNGMYFGAAGLCAVLGMLTKEVVITLPVMVLFLEGFFFCNPRQSRLKGVRGYRWILGLTLAGLALIIPAVFSFKIRQVLLQPKVSWSHPGDLLTLPVYLMTQLRVFVKFLQLWFVPVGLNLDHDFVASSGWLEPRTWLSGVVLLLLGALAWRLRRKEKLLSFAIVWFFVTLSANLVPRRFVFFEHKLYLVSVGFCLGVPYLVSRIFPRRKNAYAVLIVIILVWAGMTFQRNLIWRDPVLLWQNVVSQSPYKPGPWLSLGNAYRQAGQWQAALRCYEMALHRDPAYLEAWLQRALVYFKQGRFNDALADYDRAIAIDPAFARAYNNKANVLRQQGELKAALTLYARVLALEPDYLEARYNQALVYEQSGEFDLAWQGYSQVLSRNPDFLSAYNNRAGLAFRLGRLDAALKDYTAMLKRDPSSVKAYYNRAQVHEAQGRPKAAIADYVAALRLDPAHARAQRRLQRLLADPR